MKKTHALTLTFILILANACNPDKNWEETKKENTVSAYQEFLKNNPETEHKDSINLLIKKLDWAHVRNSNSVSALDSFALKYPDEAIYLDSIQLYKEDLNYAEALSKNTAEAYEKFLADFPQSSYRDKIRDKFERLKWLEAKNKNTKAGYIEFLANAKNKSYIDSIDLKFEIRDFIGYAVSFYGEEKIDNDVVSIIFTFNFNPNRKLTGVYDGKSEGDYNVNWSGEIRGKFDENGPYDLKKRMTDFSDAEKFEAEPWTKFKLDFNKDQMTFVSKNRTYRLVGIKKIAK